jgi:hypothetical protein
MLFDAKLKKDLSILEEFYTYTTQKDGSVVRKLQTETFSESKNPIMSVGSRKVENIILFNTVNDFEKPIMFEQLAYSLIEDIIPITDIKIPTTGLTSDKIEYMYYCMQKDTFCDNKDHEIARDVLELKKKSKSKIAQEKAAVTEILLNVKPGMDFDNTYFMLMEIYTWFGYKYDDGHVAIVVK